MKILIVDDSRAMRMLVKRTLRQTGVEIAEIEEAADGNEGLAKVADWAPDLIFCDWNMPEMNGIDFLQKLRGGGNQTPFVFVTSEISDELRERAFANGAQSFVTKPFTVDAFNDVFGLLG
jgi:two-component system chemotaxis response regulator CheY